MNDYLLAILMRQRHEQIVAEVGAARAWKREWQHSIRRIPYRLPSFVKERKIPIWSQAPTVNERNRT